MKTKLLFIAGAVVIAATGVIVLDSLEKNRGYVDPHDEPAALPDGFVIEGTGGGTFNIGDPITAGFIMSYTGNIEGKDDPNSRFFVDEVTVFATSEDEVTSPSGKAIKPVNGTALLNGESVTFDLSGYTCAKEGLASFIFTKAVTRYDIAGEPQKDYRGRFEQHWSDSAQVSVECVAGVEMMQIDVQNPAFQAGTQPLGWNEAETGYLHEDGNYYYNGEIVDREGNNEGSIIDDLGYDE